VSAIGKEWALGREWHCKLWWCFESR